MTREQLEILINDAADGDLTEAERMTLEREMESYPDLREDYREILSLPDVSGIYGSTEEYRDASRIRKIRELLIETDEDSFSLASLFWFRKVALAASLLILAASSLTGFLTGTLADTPTTESVTLDELIYPSEQNPVEEYASYLSDWPEQVEENEMNSTDSE
jgi:hypothetical protein